MMTFAEKLSHVAEDDPKFARSVKRIRIASWVFGVAVVAALGFALWSLAIGFSNQTQITKIESPCLKYGAKSEQCKEAFEQAVLTITHPEACAIERKAGPPTKPSCIGARLDQERQRHKERAATAKDARGGDALHTGPTGHQQPTPSPSGSGGIGAGKGGEHGSPAPGHGGSGGPPSPPGGGSDSVPAPPSGGIGGQQSSASPAPPASEAAQLAPSPLPEAVEAAGGAVEDTGDAAQGVVEGAGKTVNCVLRGSC